MKKSTLISALAFLASASAHAEGSTKIVGEASVGELFSQTPMYAISAGFAIGVAALGGAIGQGKIAAAAMDGLARNPQAKDAMFVPMIIGLVLIESLVIYALLISFQLVGVATSIIG